MSKSIQQSVSEKRHETVGNSTNPIKTVSLKNCGKKITLFYFQFYFKLYLVKAI